MQSPVGNHELRPLAGNHEDLWKRGDHWVKLGDQMKSTATELRSIGDSSIHKSMGTDKLAEMATDTAGDLEDAGVRYNLTGKAIRTYANALEVAQNWLKLNIDDVEAAQNRYESALEAKEDAEDKKDDLGTTMPWEDDPTDAEKNAAATAASEASGAVNTAEATRDEKWREFDHVFETWSDAYDDAVDGIGNAMDTADNNDGFWEALGDLLDVIGWVIIVLTVIALIIGAPLFGILGMIILTLTAFVFLAKLLMAFNGEATWSDVVWAGVSLLPFGLGKLLSKGATIANVVRGGRGVVTTAIRQSLPRLSLLRPSTWTTPMRSLVAPVRSWLALPKPGLLINPWRAIRLGGQEAKIATFLNTMRQTQWASNQGVAAFIRTNQAVIPRIGEQVLNVSVFGVTFGSDLADGAGIRPDIPGLVPNNEPTWTG